MHYSQKSCLRHTGKVDKCRVMSQRSDGECLVCEGTHFLTIGGSCQARANNDPFCATFSLLSDQCLACQPGYALSPLQFTCFAAIKDCLEYQWAFNSLACKACPAGYALEQNRCAYNAAPASLPNCAAYTRSLQQCERCQPGYALVQNSETKALACVLQSASPALAGCQAASLTGTAYACTQCPDASAMVSVISACVPDPQLGTNRCAEFLPGGAGCKLCMPGYFLAKDARSCNEGKDSSCLLFAEAPSAETLKDMVPCLVCPAGSFPLDGFCVSSSRLAEAGTNNCLQTDAAGNCLLCRQGYQQKADAAAARQESVSCVPAAGLPVTDANCASWTVSTDYYAYKRYECAACRRNHYLRASDSTCVQCFGSDCAFLNSPTKVQYATGNACLVLVPDPANAGQSLCVQFHEGQIPKYSYEGLLTAPFPQGLLYFNGAFYAGALHFRTSGNIQASSAAVSA